jgi:hypothetical protein
LSELYLDFQEQNGIFSPPALILIGQAFFYMVMRKCLGGHSVILRIKSFIKTLGLDFKLRFMDLINHPHFPSGKVVFITLKEELRMKL